MSSAEKEFESDEENESDDDGEPGAEEIREVISVTEPTGKSAFYAVVTSYEPMDAINAVGQIVRFDPDPDGTLTSEVVVNSNDDMRFIWSSPQGNLWVGGSDGRVWTTADVNWDTSKIEDIEVSQCDPDFQWKGTEPRCTSADEGWMISSAWGSSDRDIHFGTFQGAILHWNGKKWSCIHRENEHPIQDMHGTSPKNIWAVGRDGVVLHFDGTQWRKVPLPGDAEEGENLTGVWALSEDEVHICSQTGTIFHGNHNGLERLGEYPHEFYGIVEFRGALYLAAGDDGVCSLKGNKIKRVRKTFGAAGIYRLQKRLAFTEPDQSEETGVVIHDPDAETPWMAWTA